MDSVSGIIPSGCILYMYKLYEFHTLSICLEYINILNEAANRNKPDQIIDN